MASNKPIVHAACAHVLQVLTQFVQLLCQCQLSMKTDCCVQDELLAPVSHPVSFSDLEWQNPNASTDVVLAMGGMSIKKASQHTRQHGLKSKCLGTQPAESGNADSMFAWLSKLLPGL